MLMRLKRTVIMMGLCLPFISPILQAKVAECSDKPRAENIIPAKDLTANDKCKERTDILAKQAYELAKIVLSQQSPNQPKKQTAVRKVVTPEKIWCAQSGSTLKHSLDSWGQASGWSIKWHAEYDYPILAEVCFQGSFERAMEEVIKAYQEAEYPLYLDIYPQQQLTVISH